MQIIDKNKDFYDYLQKLYGRDTSITYDRRGSHVFSTRSLIKHVVNPHLSEKDKSFFVLEIGTIQYLFSILPTLWKRSEFSNVIEILDANFTLEKVFKDNKNYFGKEITLVRSDVNYYGWAWKKIPKMEINSFSDIKIYKDSAIVNPILRDTPITSFIPVGDIWINLSNYISSKYNDKTITIKNSDVDKLINHGFDKKSSFRHPIN